MASSNYIEEFLVGLGFEFTGDDGERFKKQTEVIASTINKVTIAAAAAATALFAMSKGTAAQNVELSKTATELDSSVEALARWRHAADQAGVGGDNVVSMLSNLRAQALEATRTGSGPFRAYHELGVDFEAIASGGQDVTDALEDIIATAQQMDRETAKGALKELGIDPKFLDTPIEKLRSTMAEADEWGNTTESLAKKSLEFSEAWNSMTLRLEGTYNLMGERLLPVFTKFFDELSEGLEWVQTEGIPILDEVVEKLGGWETVMTGLGIVAIPALIGGLSKVLSLVTGIAGGAAGAGSALALLFKGGLVGAAGYAGWEAGTEINNALPQEVQEAIGEYLAKSLAFVGVKSAQTAVEQNEGKEFPSVWDTLEKNRKAAAEKHYRANPQDRPKTGRDSQPQPTLDDWADQPFDPNAPMPEFPAAEAADIEMDGGTIPGIVNPADLHKLVPPREGGGGGAPTVIDSSKHITNHFTGLKLGEVEELMQRAEQEQNLHMTNENASPIVR